MEKGIEENASRGYVDASVASTIRIKLAPSRNRPSAKKRISKRIKESIEICATSMIDRSVDSCAAIGSGSMAIHLPMFTKIRARVYQNAKLTSRSSLSVSRAPPPRCITNVKSIVHFAAATRTVFVGLPARGRREEV